ncbi:MAG: hypothetical protein EBZ58_09395 [Bacteroidetes bacterium]|jgi:hypothetical protein|nr:hypothetical protein [Bacteroidota bacterium]
MKFIFYLALFYFVFKFLFGNLLKIKANHYGQNKDQQTNFENDAEPKIKPSNNNKSVNEDKNIGEYVDYEEIK